MEHKSTRAHCRMFVHTSNRPDWMRLRRWSVIKETPRSVFDANADECERYPNRIDLSGWPAGSGRKKLPESHRHSHNGHGIQHQSLAHVYAFNFYRNAFCLAHHDTQTKSLSGSRVPLRAACAGHFFPNRTLKCCVIGRIPPVSRWSCRARSEHKNVSHLSSISRMDGNWLDCALAASKSHVSAPSTSIANFFECIERI